MVKTFNYDNTRWEYVITYKQQKHMYLKVRNDQIMVSAPFFMQEKLVEAFILKNIIKILQQKKTIRHNIVLNNKDNYLYFLNQKYNIVINYDYHQKTLIYFEFNNLIIHTKMQEPNQLLLKIQTFLKQAAVIIFYQRLQYWSEIMNITFSNLKIRSMVNKWGTCQPRTKIITLNYKLIHYSYDTIDYVVIHELAHIIHAHHQISFWKLVAQFCPNYQAYQNTLKQQGG